MPYKDADAALARLAQGFERFRAAYFDADRALYDELVWEGQNPRVMVIGCSDSRADPQMITDAPPGEIFTVRNVAALVPPYMPDTRLAGVSSALEFGVKGLEVAHIVVLGHAMCGGIRSLMEYGDADPRFEFISRWVAQLKPARDAVEALGIDTDAVARTRKAERLGVLVSLANLMTYPWIAERVAAGRMSLHAWFFDFVWGVLLQAIGPDGPFEQIQPGIAPIAAIRAGTAAVPTGQ